MDEISDEELVGELIHEAGDSAEPPVESGQLDDFEAKLGLSLPPLLRELLLRSNGGEFCFARMSRNFVPPELPDMNGEELWSYVLAGYINQLDALGLKDAGPRQFLPIGDDYGGEVIGLDLRSGDSDPQVLCSGGLFKSQSLDEFDVEAPSFREFVRARMRDAREEAPATRGDDESFQTSDTPEFAQAELSRIRSLLEPQVKQIEGQFGQSSLHPKGVWFRVNHAEMGDFQFRHDGRSYRSEDLGYFYLRTREGPCLLYERDGSLEKEIFKNDSLANERRNEACFAGNYEDIFGFETVRQSKDSAKLMIFETDFREYLQPIKCGAKEFCVLIVRDQRVERLFFWIRNVRSKGQASQAVNFLLGFGYDWLPDH